MIFLSHAFFHIQERFFDRPVILADRDFIEKNIETVLDDAKTQNIACLVVGDPFWYD